MKLGLICVKVHCQKIPVLQMPPLHTAAAMVHVLLKTHIPLVHIQPLPPQIPPPPLIR